MVVMKKKNTLRSTLSIAMPTITRSCYGVAKVGTGYGTPGPKVIKQFRINSADHEILNAHKYKKISRKFWGFFQAQLSLECYFSCSFMLLLLCCFTSRVNIKDHVGTVS